MKKTKSQITLMMIVGLVLFIVIGLVFYLSKSVVKKQSQQAIKKTQETALEVQPIREFVAGCFDKVSKDAVVLIGLQGGYIYKSQNGPFADYRETDQGKFAVKFDGRIVSYNIMPPKFSVKIFSSKSPSYPWDSFPYKTESSEDKDFTGFFGINAMPPLNTSQGPNSIQVQIEEFINKNMLKCVNQNLFKDQGIEITTADPKTSVAIGKNGVGVDMNFPVIISNPKTKETTEIHDFSTQVDVRLKDIYYFVNDLVKKDIKDIKFNMREKTNEKDSFSIEVVEDVFAKDDVIIITDGISNVNGKPFKYIFGRRNRSPALYFLKQNHLEFADGYIITQDDLLKGASLEAEDPDEDSLSFNIKALANEQNLPKVLTVPELKFMVEVSDGQLMDYQIITATKI